MRLLERDAALGRLREAVAAGAGRVVVVPGEAGVGKTTLVRELAGTADARVLWAAATTAPMAFSADLLLANRATLAAADGVPYVQAIPWIVLAVFGAGAAGAAWLRVRDSSPRALSLEEA